MSKENTNKDDSDGTQSNTEVASDKEVSTSNNNIHSTNINCNINIDANDCEILSVEANNVKLEDIFDEEIESSQDLSKTLDCPIPAVNRQASDYVLERNGVRYVLYQGKNTIGRDVDNDLVIEGVLQVSRKHATITVSAAGVELTDHSLNGSGVNNLEVRHSSVLLRVSDQIYFWGSRYILKRKPSEKDLVIADVGAELLLVQKLSNYSRNNRPSAGFSLIELLVVLIVIGIISSIAVANLLSSRRAANAASAIQSMRVITSSQASYQAGVGNGDYALPSSLLNEQYIDQSVASACLPTPTTSQTPKSGYVFIFNTTQRDVSNDTLASFSVSARPIVVNNLMRSGDRSFFVDQTGVIKFSTDTSNFADFSSQPLN